MEREVSNELEVIPGGGFSTVRVTHLGEPILSIKFGSLVLVLNDDYRYEIEPVEGTKNTRLRVWVKLEDNPVFPI